MAQNTICMKPDRSTLLENLPWHQNQMARGDQSIFLDNLSWHKNLWESSVTGQLGSKLMKMHTDWSKYFLRVWQVLVNLKDGRYFCGVIWPQNESCMPPAINAMKMRDANWAGTCQRRCTMVRAYSHVFEPALPSSHLCPATW